MPCAPKFTPHPKSAPGDFYVVKGECLACGVPQVVAPDLVGWTGEEIPHCFWKKQPETEAEFERAVGVPSIRGSRSSNSCLVDSRVFVGKDEGRTGSCSHPSDDSNARRQSSPYERNLPHKKGDGHCWRNQAI